MSVLKASADRFASQSQSGGRRATPPRAKVPGQRKSSRRVVAGVDGSPNSVAALQRAAAQA